MSGAVGPARGPVLDPALDGAGARAARAAGAVDDDPTPAFDHRDAGTPESAWRACAALGALAPLDASPLDLPGAHLVVLAAHPDDESLGAGGLIALAAAAGARVDVVVATDGEASHPRSPTHTPAQLARTRRGEVAEAVRRLGGATGVRARPPAPGAGAAGASDADAPAAHPPRLHALGLPDGGLAAHEDDLVAALAPLVGPGAWLVAPWRHDGHPDHEAAGRAAARVAAGREVGELLEHPVWAWHWADPAADRFAGAADWSQLVRVDLPAPVLAAKRSALAAHASQVLPLSPAPGDEPVVPAWFSAHFERDAEAFVRSTGRSTP